MEMEQRDPTLRPLLDQAAAYVVFPSVGKGAFVVGGAFGRGVLYENHQPTGFVELKQGSIGAQAGGATFSELVVLNDPYAVQAIRAGKFKFGANVTAVALTAGAARSAAFGRNPNPVFVMSRGGLMVGISVTGQSLAYKPFIDEQAMR
jgi:lipid-binding SYLF domain-containing protein